MTDIRISQITLAAEHVDQMQIFYNVVFGANFRKYELKGHDIFEGELGGIRLTLVPNSLLGVIAARNRFQFDFSVPDVQKWVDVALAFGGEWDGEAGIVTVSEKTFASLLDPDGNSIVIMQATDEAAADDDEEEPGGAAVDAPHAPPAGGLVQTMVTMRQSKAPADDDIDFIIGGKGQEQYG
jgi:predicted enzyme related to lactoylglutathione lyase